MLAVFGPSVAKANFLLFCDAVVITNEHPMAELFTSLSKRRVSALSSASAFNHDRALQYFTQI